MISGYWNRNRTKQGGQIIPLFALFLVVLILMIGLAIDLGYAYLTRAALSKAVDAACLAGMRNLGQGTTYASSVAKNAFTANYGVSPSRDATPPTVNVTFSTDASNNTLLTVSATTSINTFFIRILPQWQTLTISTSAQSTRPKLIMSLVLDRSGSMKLNGGDQALPPAVTNFMGYFDDNVDQLAMVSFSTDSKVNVTMRTSWKNAMTNAVNSMVYAGATFSVGALSDGFTQINNGVASGQDVVKVAVFFTDGLANTIQQNLGCTPTSTLNFGGYDNPVNYVGFFDPANSTEYCYTSTPGTPPICTGGDFCSGVQYRSPADGTMKSFSRTNVTSDAEWSALQVANQMRAQGITVYSIGLGNLINQQFLQEVANDPASPTFNPNAPVGEADFAPQASDLNAAFQTIASKILLRLTQ